MKPTTNNDGVAVLASGRVEQPITKRSNRSEKRGYGQSRVIPCEPDSSTRSSPLSEPPEELSLQFQSRASLRVVEKISKQELTMSTEKVFSTTDTRTSCEDKGILQPTVKLSNVELPQITGRMNSTGDTEITSNANEKVFGTRDDLFHTVSQPQERLTIRLPPRKQKMPASDIVQSETTNDMDVDSTVPLALNVRKVPTQQTPSVTRTDHPDASMLTTVHKRKQPTDRTMSNIPPNKRFKPQEVALPGTIERQTASCNSRKYQHSKRCVACISKKTGEPCRFSNIRAFIISPDGVPSGPAIWNGIPVSRDQRTDIQPIFNNIWYDPPNEKDVKSIKRSTARILLPILLGERQSLAGRETTVIRRTREVEVRVTCDRCLTSVFSTSFICTNCGREFCLECYASLESAAGDQTSLHQKLVACGAAKSGVTHGPERFLPVSRLEISELDANIAEMKKLLGDEWQQLSGTTLTPGTIGIRELPTEHQTRVNLESSKPNGSPTQEPLGLHPGTHLTQNHILESEALSPASEITPPETLTSSSKALLDTPMLSSVPQMHSELPTALKSLNSSGTSSPLTPVSSAYPSGISSPITRTSDLPLARPLSGDKEITRDPAGIDSLNFQESHYSEISDILFQSIWQKGETIVVTGLLDKMNIQWTPEYFIQHYGNNICSITDCDTEMVHKSDVSSFFQLFGGYSERGESILKLKDWPPTADFKNEFPTLFDDFHRAVPAPSYTRRDGFYNISAHFPLNAVVPDMGPKMYNAFKSREEGYGSTRLHMDMADAVNIMLYSAPLPGETIGYAVWDIYPSSSSGMIRKFLKEEYPLEHSPVQYVDPIHSQYFYLTPVLRRKLYERYAVQSWRIYQKPGDAVFIPAGCAHQVCNLADCIKVAVDFVSPENLSRCGQLTKEFRSENEKVTWKEDILQLSNMCWSAWENTRQMEDSTKTKGSYYPADIEEDWSCQ